MSIRFASWKLRGLVLVALLGLAACSSNDSKQDAKAGDGPRKLSDFRPPTAPPLPGERVPERRTGFEFEQGSLPRAAEAPEARPTERPQPAGPVIEVVWMALAREKALLENSRFRRSGPLPPQKIMLINESHPDAGAIRSGRASKLRDRYGQVTVLADADMRAFLKGLERSGYYRYARQTGTRSAATEDENARGLVSVNQNGLTRTLISMRGQGQNAQTRQIPRIYSEAKQAIMVLKNMSPQLSVSHVGASPMSR
jgi:hypothetical protein